MIEVPPKVWTPKIINQFKMPVYEDVDDGVFQFPSYGNCLYRKKFCWQDGDRADIIKFDSERDLVELDWDLKIESVASPVDIGSIENK